MQGKEGTRSPLKAETGSCKEEAAGLPHYMESVSLTGEKDIDYGCL